MPSRVWERINFMAAPMSSSVTALSMPATSLIKRKFRRFGQINLVHRPGGPIIKDRTFIFGDYEGLRQSLGFTSVGQVPSPAARATASAATQPYLVFYPLP